MCADPCYTLLTVRRPEVVHERVLMLLVQYLIQRPSPSPEGLEFTAYPRQRRVLSAIIHHQISKRDGVYRGAKPLCRGSGGVPQVQSFSPFLEGRGPEGWSKQSSEPDAILNVCEAVGGGFWTLLDVDNNAMKRYIIGHSCGAIGIAQSPATSKMREHLPTSGWLNVLGWEKKSSLAV